MSYEIRYPMEIDDDSELVEKPFMPSLRWEDVKFQRHVLNALNQMRKSRQFCDVTLRVSIFPFLALLIYLYVHTRVTSLE